MTHFKQIALIISLFLIIILGTVLTLMFDNANRSVQSRLYEDAQNTAGSLSLSLGTANGDETVMATMINANFDSGNYKYISLVDVDNQILYERRDESDKQETPQWFIHLIHIEAPIASATVSAGWSQVGVLNVQSNAAYAYNALYRVLKQLLISFGIIAVIGLIILNVLLAAILKPLKRVQLQAEAVMRNEFIIQDKIPYTDEFRDVVLGMNSMVRKVKAMFDKGNEELKRQKELEYTDHITGLKNRKYLIDKLPEYLKIDASSKGGINMMVALSGGMEANESIGHKEVDKLFMGIAKNFQENVKQFENAIVARMNGTEFALFIPDCSDTRGLEIAKQIFIQSSKLISDSGLDTKVTFLSLGLYEYNYSQTIAQVLSLSDNALSQAKFSPSHIHLEKAENAVEVMGKDAWREIINEAIENDAFSFVSWIAVNTKEKAIAHNVLSIVLNTKEGSSYSYGQFMASANQLGLSSKVYQNVINMLFKKPDLQLHGLNCSLRLSYEYLNSTQSYKEIARLCAVYAAKLPFKLIIEMPDKLVRQNTELIRLYKTLFEKYNIDMGIFEFIGESTDYQYLQYLRPVYIKAETSYFLSQKSEAVAALRLITDTVGITLVAAGVTSLETAKELEEKDIFTIQGRATEMIDLA